LSMVPIVLQEDSVVSIQCLILLSIHFACRVQPRQSYNYIRIASFRIHSLLRRYVSHLSHYEGRRGLCVANYTHHMRLTCS
jgi:hypothetical protein